MKYLLFFLILIYSCAPKTTSTADQRATVMKIHDDSMAKMGEIRTSVLKLKEKAETSPDSSEINAIIEDLESAEEGMMVWMQEYSEPEQNLDSFYDSEKIKIKKVADAIYKSLENAKKHLD